MATTPRMPSDSLMDELAAPQHGALTRAQMRAAGFSDGAISRRVTDRRLRRIHAGVFQRGPLTDRYTLAMAAVLACGGGVWEHRPEHTTTSPPPVRRPETARGRRNGDCVEPTTGCLPAVAISSLSAAALLDLMPWAAEPRRVDVLLRRGRSARRAGIRLHLAASLQAWELTSVAGVPVTSVARTITDLAAELPVRELERVVAGAQRHHGISSDDLRTAVSARPWVAGRRRILELLGCDEQPRFTRSQLEVDALALLRSGRLPLPDMNVRVSGYEVDMYWRRARLVAELDGAAFHSSPWAREADRRRDAALAAAGNRVIRLTWEDIHDDAHATLVRLSRALSAVA